jgi:hypothetical protein
LDKIKKKEFISFEQAVKMLPDEERIHTFRSTGPVILGADHDRVSLIETMKKFQDKIELSGKNATAMGHGIVLTDDKGPLFIKTNKEV